MTNAQGEQCNKIYRNEGFVVSDEWRMEMCKIAEQRKQFMSDARKNLQKEQQLCVWAKKQQLGRTKGNEELDNIRHVNEDHGRKNVDGGLDHLLILAQSAELLESGCYLDHAYENNEKHEGSQLSLAASQKQVVLGLPSVCLGEKIKEAKKNVIREMIIKKDEAVTEQKHVVVPLKANAENGESNSHSQGRIRLSQLRRLARAKNADVGQVLQNNRSNGHPDFQKTEAVPGQLVEKVFDRLDCDDPLTSCNFQAEEKIHVNQECYMERDQLSQGATDLCNSQVVNVVQGNVSHVGMDYQFDAAPTMKTSLGRVGGMGTDQVYQEAERKCFAARGREEQTHIIGDQRQHKKTCLNPVASPHLGMTGKGRRKPPSIHLSSVKQPLLHIQDELQVLKEQQRIARLARIQKANERNTKYNKQVCFPTKQITIPIQTGMGPICAFGPQWMLPMQNYHHQWMLQMQNYRRCNARQRRLLRAFERRKQLSGQHIMTSNRTENKCESKKELISNMSSNVSKEQPHEADHLAELQRIAARSLQEQRIEDQRPSQNSDKCQNRIQKAVPLIQYGDLISDEQADMEINVGNGKSALPVKGRFRLSHIKCHARLKYRGVKCKEVW